MLQNLLSLVLVGLLAPFTMAVPKPYYAIASTATPASSAAASSTSTSAATGNKLVFSHFMVGIVGERTSSSDWDQDMKLAKDTGIDAFALDIGTDSFTDTQLGYAYTSAAKYGMKLFLSFDFSYWSTSDGSGIGAKVKQYASYPAQLTVDGKVFVSSFSGNGVDVSAIEAAAGQSLFFAPNFEPSGGDFGAIQGALNWMAWPSNGANRAPTVSSKVTVPSGDQSYINALGGKAYIAPVSPWFFTHYGAEVSYSKNWVFPSDLLWYNRWREVLTLQPRFVEVITWNDYGESHYIGPLSSPHSDDGASKWVMDMPHDGWRDMAKPFIAAFKAGSTDPDNYVTEDQLVYWYRPTPKDVNCASTDNTGSRPDGWESMADEVFVVALLKEAAQLVVQSGSQSTTFQAPAGVSAWSAPMGVGSQTFTVTRSGETVLSGTSLKNIVDTCPCGIYNFNAYVGTLPAPSTIDELQPAGLAKFTDGLKVSCATNTLAAGATAASTTASSTVSVRRRSVTRAH
ncbi:alpha-1-3-glucanase/mutanase [Penicillium hispanicum]|uniref:alpha-1-3-glucanase/mutanase n=1 Tax=Penicillium hispanicum TaxID=1080232 RepID=UPI002541F6A8|nr:alpha-1-3-glucanase/mutanase [Penicillium hispanicum]KAJ5574370.1 alpha-1-3-glucanase/mutanase [Penicillium hispanicum]